MSAMKHTRHTSSAETCRSQQYLSSCVAGSRLVGRNSDEISGLTNRLVRTGCKQAGRTERESGWSLVNAKRGRGPVILPGKPIIHAHALRVGCGFPPRYTERHAGKGTSGNMGDPPRLTQWA